MWQPLACASLAVPPPGDPTARPMGYRHLRAVCNLKYSAEAWKKTAPTSVWGQLGIQAALSCQCWDPMGDLLWAGQAPAWAILYEQLLLWYHARPCQPLQPWAHISSRADRSPNYTAHVPLFDKQQLFPIRATYWNLSKPWLKTSLAQGPPCSKPERHGPAEDSSYRNSFLVLQHLLGFTGSLWLLHRVWSHSTATLTWLWGYYSSICCWHLHCSPKLSVLRQPPVHSHLLYLHIPELWLPSHSTCIFSYWTDVSFQQYLLLQDLCHLPSNISCSPGSDAHSSWALLKDTARPAVNCCSPRDNQGRPRAFTSGIYFPYTLN